MSPKLDRLRLTPTEFLALPIYSASLPTGTTIGKRWRRLDGDHDLEFKARGGQPRWMIGEYHEVEDKNKVGIRWYKPIIVVRSDGSSMTPKRR